MNRRSSLALGTLGTLAAISAIAAPTRADGTAPPSSSSSVASVVAAPPTVTGCHRLALALVVDRSGSMSGAPLAMAKNAASSAIDRLGADDCVTVVAFDSTPTRIVALQGVAHAAPLKVAVGTITAGGGTDLLPAIDAAQRDLRLATHARRKHVVLLTDGQSPIAGLRALATDMHAHGISLTTVGLGQSTDETTLKMLASEGDGRFYKVGDASALPRIFSREVTLALTAR